MRINQIVTAFNAYRNLSSTRRAQARSLERLSSGLRINRAADDAAGLVNSENMRTQIGGAKAATRNAQDAISLVQTAESAQAGVHSILQRMRDLVLQSGNVGANDDDALRAAQEEITELAAELNRVAGQTRFGTKKILDGSLEVTTVAAVPATSARISGSVAADTVTAAGDLQLRVDGGGPQSVALAAGDDVDAVATKINTAGIGVTASNDAGTLVITSDSTGSTSKVTVHPPSTASVLTALKLTPGQTDAGEDGTDAYDTGGAVFQVGANAGQTVRIGVRSVMADRLGTGATGLHGTWSTVAHVDITDTSTQTVEKNVADALRILDDAIATVSASRAKLGAFHNRIESAVRALSVAVENLSATESRIRDTDMAQEMAAFTRHQIMQQAGTAMLAQATQTPQAVLSLLR